MTSFRLFERKIEKENAIPAVEKQVVWIKT